MKLSWNSLFSNGSIVDLHVSVWGARTKIKAADLGVEDTEEVRKALSLGSHRLAPAEAFDAINEAARGAKRSVDFFSLNFALIRGARYVPDNNIERLMERLGGFKRQFNEAVEEFVSNYGRMKEHQLPIIQRALYDAAKTEEAAANAFDRINAEYPSAEVVREKFKLRWSVYAIQGAKSKAALDAISQETDEVKSVVHSMVNQLRGEITEKLGGILDIVARGGRLSAKSLDSALEVLDRVETLNVLQDEVLAQQIAAMRNVINSVDLKNVDPGFSNQLSEIKKELEDSAEKAVRDAESALTGMGRRKLG